MTAARSGQSPAADCYNINAPIKVTGALRAIPVTPPHARAVRIKDREACGASLAEMERELIAERTRAGHPVSGWQSWRLRPNTLPPQHSAAGFPPQLFLMGLPVSKAWLMNFCRPTLLILSRWPPRRTTVTVGRNARASVFSPFGVPSVRWSVALSPNFTCQGMARLE
jgi:hypothetical protein